MYRYLCMSYQQSYNTQQTLKQKNSKKPIVEVPNDFETVIHILILYVPLNNCTYPELQYKEINLLKAKTICYLNKIKFSL